MNDLPIRRGTQENDRLAKLCKPLEKTISELAPANGSALVWSSKRPRSPGLYWTRWKGQKYEMKRLIRDAFQPWKKRLKMDFQGALYPLHMLPKGFRFQWAGPIPEPKEPNDD